MNIKNEPHSLQAGLVDPSQRHFTPSSPASRQTLDPVNFFFPFYDGLRYLVESAWGLVAPSELSDALFPLYAQATISGVSASPINSITFEWRALDNSFTYTSHPIPPLPGPTFMVHNDLPWEVFEGAVNKTLEVHYTVQYEDNTSRQSPRNFVTIQPKVNYAKTTIESGLAFNDTFNPNHYPEGLRVQCGPMTNTRPYQRFNFHIVTLVHITNGAIILDEEEFTFDSGLDSSHPFSITIPARMYKDLPLPNAELSLRPQIHLLPANNPSLVYSFGGGTLYIANT